MQILSRLLPLGLSLVVSFSALAENSLPVPAYTGLNEGLTKHVTSLREARFDSVIEQYEEEPYYGRHSYEHFIRRALKECEEWFRDEWRRAPTTAEFKAGVRFSMPRNIGATVQVAEDPWAAEQDDTPPPF
mgnify:CR=1 FL=1